ncbi:MAG: addiction module protein [Sandaracinaceae bacterium]
MTDTAEQLDPLELAEGRDLAEEERAETARLWKSEVRRRGAEIDAGTARLVPADEVMAGLRQLIEEHRR